MNEYVIVYIAENGRLYHEFVADRAAAVKWLEDNECYHAKVIHASTILSIWGST